VQLTHANAVFAGIFGAQAWKVAAEDRHLLTLPLFHINAQFISLMPTLTAGATLILTEQFSAARYMEQVRGHRSTTTSLVGAMVRMILHEPSTSRDADNSLRIIMYAIAVTDDEWSTFESRFQVRLCDLWGMTETLGATTINPIDGIMKKNCVGIPRLGNAVKVVDGNGVEVPAGTAGEIVVQGVPGRTIMKGYYKNAEATRETVRDGWLHTGDYASMDEDGYFHFIGRKKS
jgi:crotonobetaine/carnitine-CoA ligase